MTTRRTLLSHGAAWVGASAIAATQSAAQTTDEMVYMGWSHTEAGSKPFFDTLFAKFRSAHPTLKFEVVGVPFGQYETTLLLRKRSAQRVDAAQMSDRALAPFVAAGGLVDVDQAYGADRIDAKFDATALKMTTVGGKRYGLPWVTGTIGLVANGLVLKTAGLSGAPKSLDEFVGALEAIKKAIPSSSPLGVSTKSGALAQFESQLFFWAHGARVFDDDGKLAVDSAEARKALTFLADLVKRGLILPGNDRFDFRKLFAQEQVGFYPDQPLARAFARDLSGKGEAYMQNVVPVSMPVAPGVTRPVSILGGHVLIFTEYGGGKLSATGPAGMFADLIMSKDVQIGYYKATGFFPTNKEAVAALKDDQFFVQWNDVNSNARADELAPFLNANDLRTIVGEEIVGAMLGQKTPDDAIATMAKRLNAAEPRR